MHLTVTNLGAALLWTVIGGLAAWLLLWPLRRRSLTGLLVSLVLTGAAASAGALWGAISAMLVPWWDWKTVIALTAFSVLVTGAAAWAAARRLNRDAESLRQDLAELGEGRVPAEDGRRLTAEVEAVRRELRATATALAETRERERALESSRRELVSWVSHDLRTPLAGLRAMAEALEDGVVDDPELYYKQIGAAVARLNGMVEDLFDLSRIQAGGLSAELSQLALSDVVAECLTALEPLAAANEVRLVHTVDSPATVRGGEVELGRALTNLVANAIRYTPPKGRVAVRVGVRGTEAEVSVRDECGGIPTEHLARVFDVGFRGETARTPAGPGGAGLGLAITRGIVEAHGGSVAVDNVAGGCCFRVRLPLTS